MEKILEKLEEVKREITEEIKELRKENQEVKRKIEQLREEFCGEMREREENERGEILSEDGREIGWMKEVWKRRERIEKERVGE
jgi:hypothetical protein